MITNKPAVDMQGVSFSRGPLQIVRDFSLTIPSGQLVALLGTNGSGKSTILDLMTGSLTPDAGAVSRASERYAFVPQRSALNEHIPMTAWDAVAMGRWGTRKFWSRTNAKDRAVITSRMEELQLSDLAGKQFSWLSGGQRQRVLLAQALVQEAPLLLLDEPEAGLDSGAKDIIRQTLSRASTLGTTIIIATHDLDTARIADRCILIKGEAGGIIADGPPSEVLTDHTLALAFD